MMLQLANVLADSSPSHMAAVIEIAFIFTWESIDSTTLNTLITSLSIVVAFIGWGGWYLGWRRREQSGPPLSRFLGTLLERFDLLPIEDRDGPEGAALLSASSEVLETLKRVSNPDAVTVKRMAEFCDAAISHGKEATTEIAYQWLHESIKGPMWRKSKWARRLLKILSPKSYTSDLALRLRALRSYSAHSRKLAFTRSDQGPKELRRSLNTCTEHLRELLHLDGSTAVSVWSDKVLGCSVNVTASLNGDTPIISEIAPSKAKSRRSSGEITFLIDLLIDVQLTANLCRVELFAERALAAALKYVEVTGRADSLLASKLRLRLCETLVFWGKYGRANELWNECFSGNKLDQAKWELGASSVADAAILFRIGFVVTLNTEFFRAFSSLVSEHKLYLEEHRVERIEGLGLPRLIEMERRRRQRGGISENSLVHHFYLPPPPTSPAPRALIIAPSTHYSVVGGAEVALQEQVSLLARKGARVFVWSQGDEREITSGRTKYYFFPRFLSYYNDAGAVSGHLLTQLSDLLDEIRPEVVHVCGFAALNLAQRLEISLRATVLFSYFETPYQELDGATYPIDMPNPWQRFLPVALNIVRKGGFGYFVPFSTTYDAWIQDRIELESSVSTIIVRHDIGRDWETSVEAQTEMPPLIEGRYIICPSRLVPRKGMLELAVALHRLDPMIKLVVTAPASGPGIHDEYRRDFLRRMAEGLSSTVYMPSVMLDRVQTANLVAHCEFAVFPSYHEGYGIAALEVAAAGKVVVAFSIPGFVDVLAHGGNASLVSPFDFDEMARRVSWLYENPSEIAMLGARAKKHTRNLLREIRRDHDRLSALFGVLSTDNAVTDD